MDVFEPIQEFRISQYAQFQMDRLDIHLSEIRGILRNPRLVTLERPGLAVYQDRILADNPEHVFSLRIFMNIQKTPPEVVSVDRTGLGR
jgi:hypothetical protein